MHGAFKRLSRSLKKKTTSRFRCSSRESLVFSRVIYPQAQFECQSGSLRLQRWYAPPSKCKAGLRLLERGLTLPSSGRAFGTPLKSNVRRHVRFAEYPLSNSCFWKPLVKRKHQ